MVRRRTAVPPPTSKVPPQTLWTGCPMATLPINIPPVQTTDEHFVTVHCSTMLGETIEYRNICGVKISLSHRNTTCSVRCAVSDHNIFQQQMLLMTHFFVKINCSAMNIFDMDAGMMPCRSTMAYAKFLQDRSSFYFESTPRKAKSGQKRRKILCHNLQLSPPEPRPQSSQPLSPQH